MYIRLLLCLSFLSLNQGAIAQLAPPKTVHGILVNYEALVLPEDRMDTSGLTARQQYQRQLTDLILHHLDWLLDSAHFAILEKSGLIREPEGNTSEIRQLHLRYLPGQSDTVSGDKASSPKFIHNMQIYGLFATDGTELADTAGNTNIINGKYIDVRIQFTKMQKFETEEYAGTPLHRRYDQVAGAAIQIILSTDDSLSKIRLFNKLVLMRGAFSFNEFFPTPNRPTIRRGIKIEIAPEFAGTRRAAAVGFIVDGKRDTFYVNSDRLPSLLQSFVALGAGVNGEKPVDKKALDQEIANIEGLSPYSRPKVKRISEPAGQPH